MATRNYNREKKIISLIKRRNGKLRPEDLPEALGMTEMELRDSLSNLLCDGLIKVGSDWKLHAVEDR